MNKIQNLEVETIINLKDQVQYISESHSITFLANNNGATLMLMALCQGLTIPTHITSGEILILILEGEGVFTLNGIQYNLKTNESIIIPQTMQHSVSATTNLKFLLTIIK